VHSPGESDEYPAARVAVCTDPRPGRSVGDSGGDVRYQDIDQLYNFVTASREDGTA
jgi:hypothetical protein